MLIICIELKFLSILNDGYGVINESHIDGIYETVPEEPLFEPLELFLDVNSRSL